MSDEDVVYTMDVDLDSSPKGEPIQIAGLGTFENGGSYQITKAEADAFRSYNTRNKPILGDNDEILGSESELGPTLLQASKTMVEGITVSTGSGNNDDDDDEDEDDLDDNDEDDDEDEGGAN